MNIFIIAESNTEKIGILTGEHFEKIDACDMPEFINTKIQKLRTSTFVYIKNFNLFRDDYIKTLALCGIDFIPGNPSLKKMGNMQCKSLMGGDIPTVYHLTVKNHNKKIVFMDLDKFFRDPEGVLKSWGDNSIQDETEKQAYAYKTALKDLYEVCKIKRKIPMTITGCARSFRKKILPYFSPFDCKRVEIDKLGINLDEYIRPMYHGGLCIYKTNEEGTLKEYGEGICLDVHSMYPYVMCVKRLPMVGPLEYEEGKPTEEIFEQAEREETAIFMRISAKFKLKKGGVPCVRTDNFAFGLDWLESSAFKNSHTGKLVECELSLTYMDYIDFVDNYEIKKIKYIDYVTIGMEGSHYFIPYVRPLYKMKRNETGGKKAVSKILLNCLSGQVSMREQYENYEILVKQDGEIKYKYVEGSPDIFSCIYIGAYVTSWARHILIQAIKENYDRWVYSDTDCIFLTGKEIPKTLQVGEGLGKWAIEKSFKRLMIYKQKAYGYIDDDGKVNFTIAGVSEEDKKSFIESIEDDLFLSIHDFLNTEKVKDLLHEIDFEKNRFEKISGFKLDLEKWQYAEDLVEKGEKLTPEEQAMLDEYNNLKFQLDVIGWKNGKIDPLKAPLYKKIEVTQKYARDFVQYEQKSKKSLRNLGI